MTVIRIKNMATGLYLADDCTCERWTNKASEAAEYDSREGALHDIEGAGIENCVIVEVDRVR